MSAPAPHASLGRRGFISQPHRVDCMYVAPHNLAFKRPTRQSSTYAQKFSYLVLPTARPVVVRFCEFACAWVVGLQAVNGETDGASEATCTHTQYDEDAWWEVDLGSIASIDRVVVYSRQATSGTNFAQRICPYYIMGSVRAFPGSSGRGSLQRALDTCGFKALITNGKRVLVWDAPPGTICRYLRCEPTVCLAPPTQCVHAVVFSFPAPHPTESSVSR